MKHDFDLDRRKFLVTVGRAGLAVTGSLIVPLPRAVNAQTPTPPQEADYAIRIAPVSHEIAPGKVIKTTAYNGSRPGSALRLKEGKPVRIDVINESGYPNLIHWHGLQIPSEQDGSTEEGSPIIAPGQSLTYAFTPKGEPISASQSGARSSAGPGNANLHRRTPPRRETPHITPLY
jgi:FtsP/CotA-like multicopper oxidase with cupredoxin domain